MFIFKLIYIICRILTISLTSAGGDYQYKGYGAGGDYQYKHYGAGGDCQYEGYGAGGEYGAADDYQQHRFTCYGAGVSIILCFHHHHQLHKPLLLWVLWQ